MELWHRSIMAVPVGTHLVPMAYWYGNEQRASFVYFHEERERAMMWSRARMCGYSLYRVNSEDIKDLEPHPHTPRIWKTRNPVSFDLLELVERDDNPTTLPGLREMLEVRASELGTLTA
jgi:hypothetical protein